MLYSLINIEKPISSGMKIQALWLGRVNVFQPDHHPLKKQNDSQGQQGKSDVLFFWPFKFEKKLEEKKHLGDDTETLSVHNTYYLLSIIQKKKTWRPSKVL